MALLFLVSAASAGPAPAGKASGQEASAAEPSAAAKAEENPAANGSAEPSVPSRESDEPLLEEEQRPSPVRAGGRLVGFVATPYSGGDGSAGLGFGVGAEIGLQRIPLTIGLDVMTAYFGSDTSRIQIQAGDRALPADRTRQDLAYFFDLSLRAQPIDWWVRPYLEGFVGTKLLTSKYSLAFVGSDNSTDVTTDHDWAGSIGWGAGVDLGKAGPVNLTLGIRRLSGARASFSRAADVGGDGTVRYTVPTSNTFFMLGVSGAWGIQKPPTSDPVASKPGQ